MTIHAGTYVTMIRATWMEQEVFVVWSILGYCFILLTMKGGKRHKLLPMTFG
jgi:hypothetical protein